MRHFFILISSVLISYVALAQMPGGGSRTGGAGQQMRGRFYGKLVDAKTEKPIEYASVQLVQSKFDTATRKRKDVVVSGMLTKANGEFSLENIPIMGKFKLKVSVVGFKPYEKDVSFDLKPGGDMSSMLGGLDKDLGNVKIDV